METLRCTIKDIASKLLNNEIGAIFQGKLELGPRALGNRSIIADPRMEDGKDRVNEVKKGTKNRKKKGKNCGSFKK